MKKLLDQVLETHGGLNHFAKFNKVYVEKGNAWYQTFPQDMVDMTSYSKLILPVLGLGSTGYGWLQTTVTPVTTNIKLGKVEQRRLHGR